MNLESMESGYCKILNIAPPLKVVTLSKIPLFCVTMNTIDNDDTQHLVVLFQSLLE